MKSNTKSIEATASETLDHLNASARECLKNCETRVRQDPITSMIGAVILGYFIRFLPIGFILGAVIRLALLLFKPALLLVGVAKLYQRLHAEDNEQASSARKDKPGTATDPVQESPPGPPANKRN